MIETSGSTLRELSKPTIEYVAQQAGARKLCRALALSEGFSFQLVVCNTTRAATGLQLWLTQAVGEERGEPVLVERLSPYPLDWREPGPSRLDAEALGEIVLAKLVGDAGGEGRLMFIDAARARARDVEAWRSLLLRLNERRNRIARDLGAPLTLILPPNLESEIARLAPDLWSIRSVAVEVCDLDDAGSARGMLEAFELAQRSSEDAASLNQAVDKARVLATSGSDAALRSLRVLLLRLAGLKQRLGEFDEAERLVDEATVLAERVGDPGARAACDLALSELVTLRGDYEGARRLIESAIVTLQAAGDDWALAVAWSRLANVHLLAGELDVALRIRREEELPIYERLGDVHSRADAMGKIAGILFAQGELDEVLRIHREEQLPVYEQLGDIRSRAVAMGKIAYVLVARGEFDEALRILREEELPVYERLGDLASQVISRTNLAIALTRRGRPEDQPEITTLLSTALHDAQRLGIPEARQVADVIRQLGGDPNAPPYSNS